MRALAGSPGTVGGLLLRCGQSVFAASSIAVMVSAFRFSNYTAFCYLVASMGLQLLWSFGLAVLDVYALKVKRDLHNPLLVCLFMVGDWVTAMLSLAGGCSSAGVMVLFARDVQYCTNESQIPCSKFQLSIFLAFLAWMFIAESSLVMFRLMASL